MSEVNPDPEKARDPGKWIKKERIFQAFMLGGALVIALLVWVEYVIFRGGICGY